MLRVKGLTERTPRTRSLTWRTFASTNGTGCFAVTPSLMPFHDGALSIDVKATKTEAINVIDGRAENRIRSAFYMTKMYKSYNGVVTQISIGIPSTNLRSIRPTSSLDTVRRGM